MKVDFLLLEDSVSYELTFPCGRSVRVSIMESFAEAETLDGAFKLHTMIDLEGASQGSEIPKSRSFTFENGIARIFTVETYLDEFGYDSRLRAGVEDLAIAKNWQSALAFSRTVIDRLRANYRAGVEAPAPGMY